jgi:prepilin-type processing-associated H-X9-DG protein/prepilin-type N-terminal cleavage/methylation domain-containing protein
MKHRLNTDKKDFAFTLTEFLVVIAIIAIFAALLLATISSSKGIAQRIQCANNLHQLGLGLQIILSNDHGYPLYIENRYSSWINQLEIEGFGISKPQTNFLEKGVWHCPSAQWHFDSPDFIPVCYSYNAYGVPPIGTKTNALGLLGHLNSTTYTSIAESEVVAPSEMMAIGDSFDGSIAFMREVWLVSQKKWRASSRHQGKANVVFCDGHVESPTLQFLFADTSDAALSRWNRDHLPHREKLSP